MHESSAGPVNSADCQRRPDRFGRSREPTATLVSRLHPHDVGEPARKIEPGIEPVRIAFYGENPNGDWMLRVIDSAPRDMGSLDAWTLNFWLGAHPE